METTRFQSVSELNSDSRLSGPGGSLLGAYDNSGHVGDIFTSPAYASRETRECAYELKFLLEPHVADLVKRWARSRLLPDPNAVVGSGDAYTITSLYFDTQNLDVFERNGSFGRSKFRIRRYGNATTCFLERKLRTSGCLAKRRSLLPLRDLAQLAAGEPCRGWRGFWFHRRILRRRMAPTCQISYTRTARVGVCSSGPMRLTIDEGLRATRADGFAFQKNEGMDFQPRVVLELKFRRELPLLFKYLVAEFALNPARFSKYRAAVSALELAGAETIQPREPLISRCSNS